MKLRGRIATILVGSLLAASSALAANVLPTVTTFTVPTSAVSPIPVTAFTAKDTDGSVVAYMITETSTKPAATATGWNSAKPLSYNTTKTGAVTLYAWVKDNAGGVSTAKSASSTLLGGHTHYLSDVIGLTTALDAKADVSAFGTYQKKYSNIVVVAKSGGDFDTISAALASISDATVDNQYLIYVMPGTYHDQIMTKEFVAIKGASKQATKITFDAEYVGTLNITSNNSLIEDLTIVGNNPSTAVAVSNASDYRALINNCTLIATGGSQSIGYFTGPAGFEIKNSNIIVYSGGDAFGFRSSSSAAAHAESVFENSNLDLLGGNFAWGMYMWANGEVINIVNSNISQKSTGGTPWNHCAIYTQAGSAVNLKNSSVIGEVSLMSQSTIRAFNSQISGGISQNSGLLRLTNCVDGNYDPIPNQVIENFVITYK